MFLHLTGHRAEAEQESTDDEQNGAGPMTSPRRPTSRRPTPRSRGTGTRQIGALIRRNLIHIKRLPEMLIDVTIQPVMFVLLFAFVFGGSIDVPGAGYSEWLLPGIMAQTMAFARSSSRSG